MKNCISTINQSNELIHELLAGVIIRPGFVPQNLRRISNGKLYNTQTARHLARFSHDPVEHWFSFEEELYQTKNGGFFLTAEGLGGSPYGYKQEWSNEHVRGHVLIPLTEEQARNWLETRQLLNEYIEIFGCPDEAS